MQFLQSQAEKLFDVRISKTRKEGGNEGNKWSINKTKKTQWKMWKQKVGRKDTYERNNENELNEEVQPCAGE